MIEVRATTRRAGRAAASRAGLAGPLGSRGEQLRGAEAAREASRALFRGRSRSRDSGGGEARIERTTTRRAAGGALGPQGPEITVLGLKGLTVLGFCGRTRSGAKTRKTEGISFGHGTKLILAFLTGILRALVV